MLNKIYQFRISFVALDAFILTELQFLSITNCQCYGHPNLETWSEHITHCISSPSGKRWWVAIQNCIYIVSFTIPVRMQNKIPYQHNHLMMSTPSPSIPPLQRDLFRKVSSSVWNGSQICCISLHELTTVIITPLGILITQSTCEKIW